MNFKKIAKYTVIGTSFVYTSLSVLNSMYIKFKYRNDIREMDEFKSLMINLHNSIANEIKLDNELKDYLNENNIKIPSSLRNSMENMTHLQRLQFAHFIDILKLHQELVIDYIDEIEDKDKTEDLDDLRKQFVKNHNELFSLVQN